MNNYYFVTDSDSDLPFEYAREHDIKVVKMPYTLDGIEYFDDNGESGAEKTLFKRMREGSSPSTSLLPTFAYLEFFEPLLKEKDVLFIAFSSNMSNTIQNVYAAREELLQKYPERKFIVVDTLTISMPMALLVMKAHELYEKGESMEAIEKWLLENRLKSHAWLTVDDLVYLKRGGRISNANYFLGSMLKIKPVLALGKSGKIEPVDKVQGRKKAIRTLIDKTQENIIDFDQKVVIFHGDVEEEALEFKKLLLERIPELTNVSVRMIGPVIGAHCGPGTLAICFLGKERPI